MALPRQYTLYPGAYAPIALPSIAVPTAVPASKLYDDLGIDVSSMADFANLAGEGGVSADGEGVGTGPSGVSGIGATAATGVAGALGSAIGSELGQSALGATIGGLVGSVGATAATQGSVAAQGALGKGSVQAALTAINPALGAVFGLAVPTQSVIDAINSIFSTPDNPAIAAPVSIATPTSFGSGFGGPAATGANSIGAEEGTEGFGIGSVGFGSVADAGNDAPAVGDAPTGDAPTGDAPAAADAPSDGNSEGSEGGGGGGGSGGGPGGSGASGDSKIICTAMNAAYGFGSFRQAVWLQYSAKHLSPAHERGYHFIFLPLVAIAYKKPPRWYTPYVRASLEKITRLRTADLRSEMQGKNPRPVIRILRKSAEAILFAIGSMITEKEK